MVSSRKTITEAFKEYFEIIPATSDELKKEVHKLRYQVYCLETGFEASEQFPDNKEFDHYDKHSAHYLIRHRQSGEYAATTRLILPNPDNPTAPFPLEQHCQISKTQLLRNKDRHLFAEASRFCISKEFKKRKNELQSLSGAKFGGCGSYFSHDERRAFPHLVLGLFSCLIRGSAEHGIHYWYAIMGPSLIRYFATLGIPSVKIGPKTEFHGQRWPCILVIDDLLASVWDKDPQIWELFTDSGRYLNSQKPLTNLYPEFSC